MMYIHSRKIYGHFHGGKLLAVLKAGFIRTVRMFHPIVASYRSPHSGRIFVRNVSTEFPKFVGSDEKLGNM